MFCNYYEYKYYKHMKEKINTAAIKIIELFDTDSSIKFNDEQRIIQFFIDELGKDVQINCYYSNSESILLGIMWNDNEKIIINDLFLSRKGS